MRIEFIDLRMPLSEMGKSGPVGYARTRDDATRALHVVAVLLPEELAHHCLLVGNADGARERDRHQCG